MLNKKVYFLAVLVIIAIIICALVLHTAFPTLFFFELPTLPSQSRQYITTELSDYGKYTGNYDNEFPQEFITSFFPNTIENSFSDIKFEYRAQKKDTYAFEAYLEFRIEDPAEFQAFIDEHVGKNVSDFSYDTNFKEYVIADELGLVVLDQKTSNADGFYHIQCAKIGKILYSEITQQIICIALGVYDGGVVTTDFLCNYFDRFDIEPYHYPTAILY